MSAAGAAEPFGLLLIKGFLGERERREIVAEMRAARGGPATVYGRGGSGSVDERVRSASRLSLPEATVEALRGRLSGLKREVEEHFGLSLGECEEPQFLRYGPGDFFVAHQDGNTGMLRLEQESRLVSVVIFLSRRGEGQDDGDYGGGSLVFHERRGAGRFPLAGEPGDLVAFRAETTHEVTPVTSGERLSIACWYR